MPDGVDLGVCRGVIVDGDGVDPRGYYLAVAYDNRSERASSAVDVLKRKRAARSI